MNAVDPVVLDGFVGPEIHPDVHRRRRPLKAQEFDLAAVFLLPREPDLEKSGGRRAARCIDRYGSPVGGRSLYWGGWSPCLLDEEMTSWPTPTVGDLQSRYFDESSRQIGVDEANDFIFGELQNALRRQLFDNLGTVPAAIPLRRCHPPRCSSPVRIRLSFSRGSKTVPLHKPYQQSDAPNGRDELVQQAQLLCREIRDEEVHPGRIAARPGKARNESELHRIISGPEYDGNGPGRTLCREGRRGGKCNDHGNLIAHQFRRHRWEPIILTLDPTVLDRNVAALDVAAVGQTLAQPRRQMRARRGRASTENANERHPRWLRAHCEWPRGRRAAEQGD